MSGVLDVYKKSFAAEFPGFDLYWWDLPSGGHCVDVDDSEVFVTAVVRDEEIEGKSEDEVRGLACFRASEARLCSHAEKRVSCPEK